MIRKPLFRSESKDSRTCFEVPIRFKWFVNSLRSSALRSIRKGSSLCPNPFEALTPEGKAFEGIRAYGWALLNGMQGVTLNNFPVQRIMGTRSVHQLYPSKSFILKGPLKWPVLSTSVWNDPWIWQPWLFSLWSALRREMYPVWNALKF